MLRLKSSVIAGVDRHFVHNNDERRSKYNSLETKGNAARALDVKFSSTDRLTAFRTSETVNPSENQSY